MFIIMIIISIIIIYHIHKSTIIINQTTVDKFDFYLLYQKNPLVISDHIPSLHQILESWFKYNFIYKDDNTIPKWKLNTAKYTVIHNNNETNIEIHICHPNIKLANNTPSSDSKIVTINLSAHQFIIIPYKWYYFNDNANVTVFNIHDYYTRLLLAL
jgi:hypothetical protein